MELSDHAHPESGHHGIAGYPGDTTREAKSVSETTPLEKL